VKEGVRCLVGIMKVLDSHQITACANTIENREREVRASQASKETRWQKSLSRLLVRSWTGGAEPRLLKRPVLFLYQSRKTSLCMLIAIIFPLIKIFFIWRNSHSKKSKDNFSVISKIIVTLCDFTN
jgi:hypothetical protein